MAAATSQGAVPNCRHPSGLAVLVRRSGVAGLTPAGVLGACAVTGLGGGCLALAVTAVPALAAAAAVLAAVLPIAQLYRRADRNARARRDAWPRAVDALAGGLSAGLSLPEALAALSRHGPPPLREAWAGFGHDWGTGRSVEVSLRRLAGRLADPVADRVIATLLVAREVGGIDDGRVLRGLAECVRADAQAHATTEARRFVRVTAAWSAVAMAWMAVGLLLRRADPVATLGPASVSIAGMLTVLMAAGCTLHAVHRRRRDPRVLR